MIDYGMDHLLQYIFNELPANSGVSRLIARESSEHQMLLNFVPLHLDADTLVFEGEHVSLEKRTRRSESLHELRGGANVFDENRTTSCCLVMDCLDQWTLLD